MDETKSLSKLSENISTDEEITYLCDICLDDFKYFAAISGPMADHVESVHHIPVVRETETPSECLERFYVMYPNAGTSACQCPACRPYEGTNYLNPTNPHLLS